MKMGAVPSEAVLERFAKGLNADLSALRRAAGYEQPSDPVEAVELALRNVESIPEEGKRQIREFVESIRNKYQFESRDN